MIIRRIGLVLALLTALAALPPSLSIEPDPSTGSIGALSVVVAVATTFAAVVMLALIVPAWLGVRVAAEIIAFVQLAGVLTSLPAFFAPASVLPPGAVIIASVGAILSTVIFAMIVIEVPNIVLHLATVILVVAAYAGLVAAAAWLLPAELLRLAQTVAVVIVAIAYAPTLSLLRRTIGRALYGGRVDPARTAVRLGSHTGDDPLQAAVEDAADSLRLPRIELRDAEHALATGVASVRASARWVDVPVDSGELILRVTLRTGERSLHHDDRAALVLVSVPLVLLARESALLGQIRGARAEVADAREREQLALHRDLHDGLGPLLTGAAMRADAARNLLDPDASDARAELDAARADLRSAIAEVRRVVYRLWPVELEQHGLWRAVAARADRSGIVVNLPAEQPSLPPAVELAAYRIASEALTNIDRHAAGRGGTLTVATTPDAMHITVESAGAVPENRDEGMGLRSIRVRAEELGGHATAGPTDSGWRVSAVLPVPAT